MRKPVLLFFALMMLAAGIPCCGKRRGPADGYSLYEGLAGASHAVSNPDWAKTAEEVTLLMLDENADLPYFPATRYYTQGRRPPPGGSPERIF